MSEETERRCFVCSHIFENTRPVCHIVFFDDGEIQIDCGKDDNGEGLEFVQSFRPVGLSHILARDYSLIESLSRASVNRSFGRDSKNSPWKEFYIDND